jgi:hypothetical protein
MMVRLLTVIPATAGIRTAFATCTDSDWIPASAGTTE